MYLEWIIPIALGLIVYFLITKVIFKPKFLSTLTEEQFKENMRKAQLIDVREPNEFEQGHILGARNIPLSQLKMRLVELRKDKPVYLYCASSTRSSRAAMLLKKNGYTNINHLQGGFKKWTGKVKKK
jgi:rhodanese-related sulfurtransferase